MGLFALVRWASVACVLGSVALVTCYVFRVRLLRWRLTQLFGCVARVSDLRFRVSGSVREWVSSTFEVVVEGLAAAEPRGTSTVAAVMAKGRAVFRLQTLLSPVVHVEVVEYLGIELRLEETADGRLTLVGIAPQYGAEEEVVTLSAEEDDVIEMSSLGHEYAAKRSEPTPLPCDDDVIELSSDGHEYLARHPDAEAPSDVAATPAKGAARGAREEAESPPECDTPSRLKRKEADLFGGLGKPFAKLLRRYESEVDGGVTRGVLPFRSVACLPPLRKWVQERSP